MSKVLLHESFVQLRWLGPDIFLFVLTFELEFSLRFFRWLCEHADKTELENLELSKYESEEEVEKSLP